VNAPSVLDLKFAGVVGVRDVALMLVVAFETLAAGARRILIAQHFD
jgi:hypothetical protein